MKAVAGLLALAVTTTGCAQGESRTQEDRAAFRHAYRTALESFETLANCVHAAERDANIKEEFRQTEIRLRFLERQAAKHGLEKDAKAVKSAQSSNGPDMACSATDPNLATEFRQYNRDGYELLRIIDKEWAAKQE